MSESTSDSGGSSTSSLQADLSNLVIWAHTHGTICNQIPVLEFMQSLGHMNNDNAALWMCRVGHAYHWHCRQSHDRGGEETEAVRRRKRVLSSDSLANEFSFKEKRPNLTPLSFKMDQAHPGSPGSCGRSQGDTEKRADSSCTRNNQPSGSQNTRKPTTSLSAVEQNFSACYSTVQADKQDMKSESDNDIQIISDDEKCEADEDNQGDRIRQDNVSEPPAEELLHCQKMALHQPTAFQKADSAPMAKPPVACAYILQTPVSDPEDPSRSILRLGPPTAAGPTTETSRARSLLGTAKVPKVCLKPLPISSTEVKAQLKSPASMVFFELQGTAPVQPHLQLSPPECGTQGMGPSGDSAENVGEDSDTSGCRQAPCSSASQSPESHAPAASNRDVLKKQKKKKSGTIVDIKAFQEWLKLHHPSETRKIHMLPPADLDHYLASFFSSAKRQNGMDFSASAFHFFQHNINQYLKKHNYQYNMLKGPEFRASQQAYTLKYLYLFKKEKEEEWSVVENLTDEDVENLLEKGILSKTHPQGLLQLVFTTLIRGFGASTHYLPQQLYWGQVVLRKTRGDLEYLEWKNDLSPGGDDGALRPRIFAKPEDPEKCPVASYKEYARKRPSDMLNLDHPLYLSPKPMCSIWEKVWYSRKTLTKSKIDKMLTVISQEVRGTVKKSRK